MKRLHFNKLSKRIIFSIALTLAAISIYLSRSITDDLYDLTNEYYDDMAETIEAGIQDEVSHAIKNMTDVAMNLVSFMETLDGLDDVNILNVGPIIEGSLAANPYFKGIILYISHDDYMISHYWYRTFDDQTHDPMDETENRLDYVLLGPEEMPEGESQNDFQWFNEFFNYKKYDFDDKSLVKPFMITPDYQFVMGKNVLLSTYGVPVKLNKESIGFIGFDLTSKFFEHLSTHIDRYPIKDYMIYSDRYVIASSEASLVGQALDTFHLEEIPWMKEGRSLSFEFTDDVQWTFTYDFNDHTLVSTIDRTGMNIYITGFFAFVIIILLNSLTINRALSPIMAINKVIMNATKGNLSARAVVHNDDEVGSIAKSLNVLLETLERNQDELESEIAINQSLNEDLKALMNRAKATYFDTIKSLVNTIEAKDGYTAGHCDRVTTIALAIAMEAGYDDDELKTILFGSSLHDIGKIAISGTIINKPTYLTDEEYAIIKSHSEKGYNIVKDVHFLSAAKDIVLQHHERYDGKGYPFGLKGEEIDPYARIVAIADTYDAMTSSRSYRGALSKQDARAEILANSGTQFDPRFVACFIRVLDSKSDI